MKLFVFLLTAIVCLGCSQMSSSPHARQSAFDVTAFGAPPDGSASSTKQIQAAIDACAGAGGGTVHIPAGNYVIGTLWMKSNVTLDLAAGATLLGSQDKSDFPEWISDWEGPNVPRQLRRYAPLIAGEGLDN